MRQLVKKIREIHEEGRHFEVAFDGAFLGDALAGMDADIAACSGGVSLELLKTGENVFVRGALTGRLVLTCVRCLGAANLDVEVPLHLTATREERAEEPPLAGVHPAPPVDDDVDYFTHDGEVVDLNQVLREAIILAVPFQVLCRLDCKGLCPVCGGDRNERDCGCQVSVVDPRFAVLEGLKKDLKT